MNILFVSAVLPYPLHSGGQVRMYNLLKRLGKRHSITLVSFIRSEEERMYANELGFCSQVKMVMRGRAWQPKYYIGAAFGTYPFLLKTYDNREMRTVLDDLLVHTTYDVMHIEPFYVIPSIPTHAVPLVISEHNIEYDVYDGYVRRFPVPFLRPLLALDVHKLRVWENNAWKRATSVTAVSYEDASVVEAYIHRPVHVISNGVDLSAFPFREPVKRKNPTIVFVGNFRWHPNRDAARELIEHIWPGIQKSIPHARLSIVGRNMPTLLKKQAYRVGAEAHDTIEDIAKVYRDADILVAPHAISGGTKFKMLEAMASGLPIVTSQEGMHGLSVTPGVQYLLAKTPSEYVAHVQTLCSTISSAHVVASHARKLVEEQYGWATIADELETVWKNACVR